MPLSASDKLLVEQIEHSFSWEVSGKEDRENYERLRINTVTLARLILELCGESRERAKALSHLEEFAMWVNAAMCINARQPRGREE